MAKEKIIEKEFFDDEEIDNQKVTKDESAHLQYLSGMYRSWFLEYASYVILERAVPHIADGLKPVQRRILHSLKRMDDGRFNKVANVIGHTMQFHPHGDASIGEALVQLGQKNLLIETQGNWGNIFTGDEAAASRYIEARLSKFALEVAFNHKTTEWKLSYDGRNKEPIILPMKFPLLLAQGVEGIAVGLASKILPHNFNELLDASICVLKNEPFSIYPDFPTGGTIDVLKYNDGLRGGRVRVRAKISKSENKKSLIINELPFGVTTSSLIESIVSANDKQKIKIRKIDDNTAENVEIVVHLIPGVSSDITLDALYAFTDCEISISPNACIIDNQKPMFIGVSEMLRISVQKTVQLLTKELEIRKNELENEWHFVNLEKIFIEKKIYLSIENCETWDEIIETIEKKLSKFKHLLRKPISKEDIAQLTEIKIKRISKFDSQQADHIIANIEKELEIVAKNLSNITDFAINYFRKIKEKYGKDKERKTEIRNFDVIVAAKVVIANEKLYFNRQDGFVGTGLKKDEYLFDCSDMDEVIVFRNDGTYFITKVAEKVFIGQNILHIGIFQNDERTIYNAVYFDAESGNTMVKRFPVKGITRDKEYNLTKGTKSSKVLYFSANPNGEAEIIKVTLKPRPRIKNLSFEFDFSTLAVKGRDAMGNILSKYATHKILMLEKGFSTLGGMKIFFDSEVLRLNSENRGTFLGEFAKDDKILTIYKSGIYELRNFDLSQHFDEPLEIIEKFVSEKVFSVIYLDAEQNFYYVKRFPIEVTEKPQRFIGDHPDSKMILISDDLYPRAEIIFGGKHSARPSEVVDIETFIGVKSFRAKGCRLSNNIIQEIRFLEPRLEAVENNEFFVTQEN